MNILKKKSLSVETIMPYQLQSNVDDVLSIKKNDNKKVASKK